MLVLGVFDEEFSAKVFHSLCGQVEALAGFDKSRGEGGGVNGSKVQTNPT